MTSMVKTSTNTKLRLKFSFVPSSTWTWMGIDFFCTSEHLATTTGLKPSIEFELIYFLLCV
uniref:Uncharacterized protein n=1 Tax=Setaria italica TaxID=4555 RepID=K3ZKW7_SETIT